MGRVGSNKGRHDDAGELRYLGLGSVVRVNYPQPQVRLDLWGGTSGTYAGLDPFGRVKDQRWVKYDGTTVLDRYQYGYDRNANRTWRDNTLTTDLDEYYTYDQLDRLIDMDRGELNATKTGIASPGLSQEWVLDAMGNWENFHQIVGPDITIDQTRQHNKANELTGFVIGTWPSPAHDAAGNMTTMPKATEPTESVTAVYDAWNRLVELKDGPSTVARYEYDGRGRRTASVLLAGTRHFYHSNQDQVLEERTGTATTAERQYVWGVRYVDELVCRDRGTARHYALQDANFNVTAIIDATGGVAERYSYMPTASGRRATPAGRRRRQPSTGRWATRGWRTTTKPA